VLVLLDDRLILTRPGAESRRAELASAAAAADALALATARIDAPGTLDGGDVLVLARHVLVGDTARSNGAGFEQLAELVRPTGRQALRVPVAGVLHLKSALTALPDGALIAAPAHVDASALEALGYRVLHAREPSGADVLCLGSCVVLPTDAPRTRDFLRAQGYRVETVDVSELQKLEAGVTCMSVLIPSTE